ncbi:hypothetical protein QC764_101455 [Podospora pseudoanserina]|uniref:DRBM domain-containing protein n=1 Tax=Podospora pseudoanserina TaxID=2609844 RepID=A0ABR0IKP9_9PEZI|nr:hypothetical protein QC764_101455 [Podospora pseudoanserina]
MASQREPHNSMTLPLRTREAPQGPRKQVQLQRATASDIMPHLGPSRPGYGSPSFGIPPAPVIDRPLPLWGQTTPVQVPQGHPGAHYGPIPIQGTPQDRFRREVLGRRGEAMGSGPRWTPAPPLAQLSLRSSGALQPYTPRASSTPRQTAEALANAPQKLSFACQRRRFNPVFEAFETSDGRHGCHVKIDGALLRSDRLFETARQAKEDAAMKGLDYLRQNSRASRSTVPSASSGGEPRTQVSGSAQRLQNREAATARLLPSQASSSMRSEASIAYLATSVARLEATIAHLQAPASSARDNFTRVPIKQDQDVEMTGVPASGGTLVSVISAAQQAELLNQIQRITGMDVINPSRESAEVTCAYLEGLAVGSRLATVARRRSRSPTRSPQTSRGRRHRERSPADARVRLTPPPVYQRWSGRPATDRYRPGEDRYCPDEVGRLRDDTRSRNRGSGSVESGVTSGHGSGRSSENESGNTHEKRSSS